jgi:uncharacterized membrane protein
MRFGRVSISPSGVFVLFPLFLVCSTLLGSVACAAEKAEQKAEQKDAAPSKDSFNLIIRYKDLTVGQGQEVNIETDILNRTKNPVEVNLNLESVPKDWEANFNSRYPSYPIRSVTVPPGEDKPTSIEFKAKVPQNTKPGNYEIKVTAKDAAGTTRYSDSINFRVTAGKVETGGLRLTTQYPVLTAPSGQTAKFTVDLKNETNKPLTAALVAQAPTGWNVRFKPQFGDTQISSIQLKENATETVSVEIDTPARAEPTEHPVTVRARAGAFETAANLKVSLKGTQDLKMGTASGTLNTSITAGKRTPVDFLVGNAGTAPIRNLSFVTKKPNDKWTVDFKPDKLDALNPGEVREVKMDILAPDRTIAGDYLLNVTANTPEVNRSVEFRVTVSTPTIWGWVGFGIVALVILGLAVVFFRLGRR